MSERIGNLGTEVLSKGELGSVDATNLTPSEDQIRLRAFAIYLARGASHGRDLDDWFQARLELEGS